MLEVLTARRELAEHVRNAGVAFSLAVLSLEIGLALPAGPWKTIAYLSTVSAVMGLAFQSIGAVSTRVSLRSSERRLSESTPETNSLQR